MQTVTPSDSAALQAALVQWQFGDWQSLANMERDTLQQHPERAKLALLAAAAQLQIGHAMEAEALIRLAQQWGVSKKLISQILIAGVHHSVASVAASANQPHHALQHLKNAMAMAAEMAFSPRPFSVNKLALHNLGDAWAGNTINTVIFRHHGILTHHKIQYTAFYVDEHTLRLVQRDLVSDTLKTHDIPGQYNLRDAHNSISLGLDRESHLHISYDHHVTQLRYRRSLKPGDITAWSDELPMTGAHEEKVTYPTFILPRQGYPLTLLYRDGVHNKGTARLKTYDEATQSWADHPQPILSGAEQKPWTSNAYWNHPAIGSDGSLHLSFVWRTDTLGTEQRINNINIGYACSHDNGLSWQTSRQRSYKLPITQVNAETIHPVSPASNLINQTSMALDSGNRPHIVFYSDDPDGIPQYQHLWFDGKVWRHQFISQRKLAFSLQGGGTLQIPICRPEVVIDHDDNVYMITRGDHTKNRMAATLLPAPDYHYLPSNTCVLCDLDLGFAEPIIDRSRWQQNNIMTLLLQNNQQPNYDINHQNIQNSVTLIDIKFS
ncbi:MAG: BNR repeat-containing protein [Giesbergeria sp.]|uniref:BNR repeat-containing protein n=1 Tax=Giesbergeria sp. TaxID=2818473 RepID=UPI0026264234|nr:BNR repeat-containing protein [Giesbergeria sp.]MDD2608881.1 BNR repeat-containing protein [Giesbergeria sp.]